MEKVCMVICACKDKQEAKHITHELIKNRFAACIQHQNIESYYEWQGRLEEEREVLLLIKTKLSLYKHVEKKIQELHSYDVPEILCFKSEDALEQYAEWVESVVHE